MKRVMGFLAGAIFGAALIGGLFGAASIGLFPFSDDIVGAPETAQTEAPSQAATAPTAPTLDPAIEIARSRARETLDVFDQMAKSPATKQIRLQVLLPALTGGEEAIWMTDCQEGGPADYVCTVEDRPTRPEVAPGDPYAVEKTYVSDWVILDRAERLHGGFTIRAELPRMAEADRAALLPRLAPLPRR